MAVYNKSGMMTYVNPAASGWTGIAKGDSFSCFARWLGGLGIPAEQETEIPKEYPVVVLADGERIRVKQYIQTNSKGELAAGIFLLSDVGEYYERMRQERELTVSERRLAIEQERNRIAQEVHDTTGHSLTMIQSLLRLIRVEWEKEKGELMPEWQTDGGASDPIGEYLDQAQELATEGIRELRQAINQMREGLDYGLVTQCIFQLAERVKEIEVEVDIQGEDGPPYSHLSSIVYECFREAITNCLKYAHATHMDVIVKFGEKDLSLYIFDDGQGCSQVKENNGIRGIRERVENAGGRVRIQSSQEEGFQIYLHLPVEAPDGHC